MLFVISCVDVCLQGKNNSVHIFCFSSIRIFSASTCMRQIFFYKRYCFGCFDFGKVLNLLLVLSFGFIFCIYKVSFVFGGDIDLIGVGKRRSY